MIVLDEFKLLKAVWTFSVFIETTINVVIQSKITSAIRRDQMHVL